MKHTLRLMDFSDDGSHHSACLIKHQCFSVQKGEKAFRIAHDLIAE